MIASKKWFSTRQIAQAIGVSEASIKRWCDKQILASEKTGGGHRRILLSSIMRFLQESRFDLVRPEVLELPSAAGKGLWTINRGHQQFRESLEQGDEDCCSQIVFSLLLAGHSVADILDRVVAAAFHEIGERWEHGDVEVFQERRGVEITSRILYRLRNTLPTVSPDAPVAIGGTLENNPYSLPGMMAELALIANQWQAEFYGTNLPVETLCAALLTVQPKLLWLNVSTYNSQEDFLKQYRVLYDTAKPLNIAIVLGGCKLSESLRKKIQYTAFCDTINHLVSLSQTLHPGK
jgi:methanogenic corrinoid protein MtbC1